METSTIGQGLTYPKGQRMSRAERKAQILQVLRARWIGYTTHGLARACGMTPSPHFRAIVYELYMNHEIEVCRIVKANKRDAYLWNDPDRDNRHGQLRLPI